MTKAKEAIPNKRKPGKFIIAAVIIVLVMGIIGYFVWTSPHGNNGGGSQASTWQPIEVNGKSLPSQLSGFSAVQDLPKRAVIGLKIGDYGYVIEKGSVTPGTPENPDAVITLPEKYFDIMGERGWCTALAIASQNNDIGVDTISGKTELAWKYRNMLKYRVCLG